MGADVIKVEPPQGDAPCAPGRRSPTATARTSPRSTATSARSRWTSRIPRSRDIARRLVLEADVADREQPARRDGRAWAWAATASAPSKPALIYCSISAFGQDGPRAAEGGFDLTMQAASGVMSVTGEPDGAPVKCGVPLSDFCAGPLRAPSRSPRCSRRVQRGRRRAAHRRPDVRRHARDRGAADERVLRHRPRTRASWARAHPRNAPYQAFTRAATATSRSPRATTSCGNRRAQVVGRPELVADPRFASTTLRAKNQARAEGDLLEAQFAACTARRTGSRSSARRACRARPSTATPKRSPIRRSSSSGWVRTGHAARRPRDAHLGLPGAPRRQRRGRLEAPILRSARTPKPCATSLEEKPMNRLTRFVIAGIDEDRGRGEGRGEDPRPRLAAAGRSDRARRLAAGEVHRARPRHLSPVPAVLRSAGPLLGRELRVGPGPADAGARPHGVGPGGRDARRRALRANSECDAQGRAADRTASTS